MFYNTTLAFAMLIGRFLMVIPALAIAGSLARKRILPPSAGTFPTHGLQFVLLVSGVILILRRSHLLSRRSRSAQSSNISR